MPGDMIPQVVRALSVGTELAFSIIIGAFIGYLVGKMLDGGWLVVGITLGVVLGFVAGIYRLYKAYG
ncbi:MAG: AtpZ/AtpI family protein [Methanocellales archaeon]|nr:AtpZ/AtpI family protein [Methanocellales archaeon]